MTRWQLKCREEWDATDGRYGDPNKRYGKLLMEMERFDGKAKEGEQGAVALVLDLSNAFPSVLGVGNALQFPTADIACVAWLLRAPEASTV